MSDTEAYIPQAGWTRRQPWRGIFAFLVTFIIALIITVSCNIESYLGLLSIWIMCMVPVELVMTIGWGGKYPPTGNLEQPWRGLALTIFMFLIGTSACFAILGFIGEGTAQPYISVFVICSVVLTIIAVVGFNMWPFGRLSVPAKGFLTLLLVHVIVFFGIRLFNFSLLSFPSGTNPSLTPPVPFYGEGGPLAGFQHLAPRGPFPWETALTCWLWIAFLVFTLVMLDFWPLNKSPRLMKQPVMGILVFGISAAGALGVFQIGVNILKMEPLSLMYHGVSYAFGLLIVLVLLRKWPGRRFEGMKGAVLNIALAVLIAAAGYHGVAAVCRWHFGNMAYPTNIFAMATFMLGLNFPLWVAYADIFNFWPLPPEKTPTDFPA